MAFNIEDFRSDINKRGILQTNKFDVNISFSGITGITTFGNLQIKSTDGSSIGSTRDQTKDLMYRCISASLPGIASPRTVDPKSPIRRIPY